MKTRAEYLNLLESHISDFKSTFGIRSLRLFGSVARDEHTEGSDIDICVEMEPDLFMMVRLKRFLEKLVGCSVDLIRLHRNMNNFLKQEIDRDGIYIFK
ncbi:nucleotidyltransferase domain-containing protein [uncultured Parabacteroides sp.]|uniref:nucleotidyltransferase family protein n=1 Tax=uncultured Parabacteroides sp. TaxID=512312 RepID=UPI00261FC302|nr:nucleotidyltransferase domain-containing protein [uncultured Parabacteroides sp.]